jgi:nucleotide-binding universal stress UspA family protein
MWRVLVPLDGSEFSAFILSDAVQLAGPFGELVLVHYVQPIYDDIDMSPEAQELEASRGFLTGITQSLHARGIRVRAATFAAEDAATSIDRAAQEFSVDAIACATHARSGWQSVLHPSVAWQVLAHSTVPVLLRRFDDREPNPDTMHPKQSRILVPLDGSHRAEESVPLATLLAKRWRVPLVLVHVVPPSIPPVRRKRFDMMHSIASEEYRAGEAYLSHVAGRIGIEVETVIPFGSVVDTLVETATDLKASYIVMASHGRTGIAKAIVGSVTHGLIQRAGIPLIVIPQTCVRALQDRPTNGRHAATGALDQLVNVDDRSPSKGSRIGSSSDIRSFSA